MSFVSISNTLDERVSFSNQEKISLLQKWNKYGVFIIMKFINKDMKNKLRKKISILICSSLRTLVKKRA